MQMNNRDWGLLLILSLLWGGAFFFVAIAVKQVPPLTVVLCRVCIGALTLYIYLCLKGEKLRWESTVLFAFLAMGALNNIIPFSLLFWAQTSIPSGLASIVNATTPMFSIIVAHFFLADEKLQLNKLVGVILGIIGVAVLVGGDALSGAATSILGIIACIGAALSYGFAAVYGRRFKSLGLSASTVAFGQLAASSLIMLPIALTIDQPWTSPLPGVTAILAIVALATISTALAYLIYFHLLASAGAANVSLVTLIIPLSAIFLGIAFLGEKIEAQHYFGLAFILAGLLAVDGRIAQYVKRSGAG